MDKDKKQDQIDKLKQKYGVTATPARWLPILSLPRLIFYSFDAIILSLYFSYKTLWCVWLVGNQKMMWNCDFIATNSKKW